MAKKNIPTPPASLTMDAVAEAARRIYAKKRAALERKYLNQFLVVDVFSGKTFVGRDELEILRKAHTAQPQGCFHLMRIGFDAVHVCV